MLLVVPESWLLLGVLAVALTLLLYPIRARSVKGFQTGGTKNGYYFPFIGSLYYVTRHFHRYHDAVVDGSRSVGDGESWTAGIPGSPPMVYAGANPQLIEHILKTAFWKYEKGEYFRTLMRHLLGRGIFNVDGGEWQKQRKVASHMFTARSLKEDMSAVFVRNARLVLQHMQRAAKDGRVIDVQELFFRFTLDSFSEVAFGESSGCLSDGSELPFARAFDTVQRLVSERFYLPAFYWQLQRALHLPFGPEATIRRQLRVMREYAFEIIERARAHRALDRSARPDLISRFIDYASEHGELVSNEDLLDVVLNFIIAGRDTTACLLSWATYELTQHPELQARLFDEVRAHALEEGDAENGGSAVRDLPLLHAFIMETLRLHPPVPQDIKECIANDVWPDGRTVPAGTLVIYSPYLMGRSARIWGANAQQFDIARWFDEQGQPIKEPSQYAMPVFNAGFRLCLGKQVAVLESSMMLALAIQQFEFTCAQESVTYGMSITMPIKNGLRVHIKQRAATRNNSDNRPLAMTQPMQSQTAAIPA